MGIIALVHTFNSIAFKKFYYLDPNPILPP